MFASRRSARQRAAAPGSAKFSLRGVLRQARRQRAVADDDSSDGEVLLDAAQARSREEQRARAVAAVECADQLFHRAKLRLLCPGRWNRLYLAAAKRVEARLDRLREATHVAAAVDDVERLAQLRSEVPPQLWLWWAFDLGLVERATTRGRPEQLETLPALYGTSYPGAKVIAARRAAIKARPPQGTPQAIQERQRGEALIAPLRKAMESRCEIDVMALDDILDHPLSGPWKTSDTPACGVNYGATSGATSIDYAGWRPLHFAAASPHATGTAVPVIRKLLGARADPTLVDGSGGTALHLATARGHLPAIEVLLKHGAPVEVADRAGCTALLSAARARRAEVVRRLAEYPFPEDARPEVNWAEGEKRAQRFSPTAGTQLHAEVAKGALSNMRHLIVVGDGNGNELANVDFPDSLGRSPAHTAVHQTAGDDRAADCLRALAAYRANIDARDFEGQTPLHAAVHRGRAPAVRTLLRLRAHPCLPDNKGYTPLMLAARATGTAGERPPYDGVLVNRPVSWTVLQDVLEWDGKGEPPGPPPRTTSKPDLLKPPALPRKGKKKRESSPASPSSPPGESAGGVEAEPGEQKDAEYFTEDDAVRARADAVAALGFDDQRIVDAEGRVNHGDRLQLFGALFQKPRDTPPGTPMQPNERRMRVLWSKLTGPLVRMEVQKSLPPRFSELLQYLLITSLGKRGAAFTILAAATPGVRGADLPSWSAVEQVLNAHKKIAARADAVLDFAFRGPKPKRALWVGSTWNRDEYPREPDTAPWYAFDYVDQATAVKLNERNEVLSDEAFNNNILPVFEESESLEAPPVPQRYEKLQLANRLFVDEALGMRVCPWDEAPLMLRVVAEQRVSLIGARLLCPLLEEAAEALRGHAAGNEVVDDAFEHRDLLRYVAAQMAEPGCPPESTSDVLRQPFWTAWQKARASTTSVLSDPVVPELAALTRKPEVALGDETIVPGEQAPLLESYDLRWLRKRHSTHAYFALRRCGAVRSADDFNELVVNLVAMAPRSFGERFWFLAFGLLIWGRATELRPFLEAELHRRLPQSGVELVGPHVRPRPDVLLGAVRATDEVLAAAARIAQGPELVAGPKVLPNLLGLSWSSSPPGPLIVGAVERRSWAAKAGFEPGDEVVAVNDVPPSAISAEDFARIVTNRPIRFRLKLREAQIEPLPPGFTDTLRAEVLCDDEEVLRAAFEGLCGPGPSSAPSLPGSPGAGSAGERAAVSFQVVRVSNGFHPQQSANVFPRAASVLLKACLSVRLPGPEQRLLRQLVEVELLLPTTTEARWLAKFLRLDPAEAGPTRVRSPGQPSGLGPLRKRPPY